MSFLDRIRDCSVFHPDGYVQFLISGETVGLIRPAFAELLAGFPEVFHVSERHVRLSADLVTPDERTAAVESVLLQIRDHNVLSGWKNEPYEVRSPATGETVMLLERAAVPKFGTVASGVHVNGVVRAEGVLSMWVGRRSALKQHAPGKLDQLVAGGHAAHMSVSDTLVKEAAEEANIGTQLIAQACPVGVITYCTEHENGLRRDVLYLYDLELSGDFQPVNTDGEIDDFTLMPIDEVERIVHDTDQFKFNCALVVIDYLMRHGRISPDCADYVEIAEALRSGHAAISGVGQRRSLE